MDNLKARFFHLAFVAIGMAHDTDRKVTVRHNLAVQDIEAEYANVEDIITGRPQQFIWSDTPQLGVGNSCDTDADNFQSWFTALIDVWGAGDMEEGFELAYIDQVGQCFYLQVEA